MSRRPVRPSALSPRSRSRTSGRRADTLRATGGLDLGYPDGTPPDGTPPDGTPPDGTPPDGTPPDTDPPDDTHVDGTRGSIGPLRGLVMVSGRLILGIPRGRGFPTIDVVEFTAACPACGQDVPWIEEREETRLRIIIECPCAS